MNEALLFATMCIIGLPVDVHLKDGSVYSGIFYTASVEKEYGIVLKKAKLTKRGRCATNVANGSVVETFVILTGDLVQVVAKGVPLPFNGFAGNIACGNGETAFEILPSSANPLSGAKKFNNSTLDKIKSNRKSNSVQNENGFADGFIPTKSGKEQEGGKLPQNPMGNAKEVEYQTRDGTNIEQGKESNDAFSATVAGRVVGDDSSQLLQDEYDQKFEFHVEEDAKEVQHSVSSRESSALDTLKPVDTCLTEVKPVEGNAEMTIKLLLSGAPHDTPIVPTVANVSQISGNPPMVAVAGSQPEVRFGTFAPRSSATSKIASYGNITAATGVSGSQFSQPIVGHTGSQTHQLRYAGQYHAVQAASAYLNPNSQAVMFGRMGQLIYLPVSHDLLQGATAITPVPACPPLTPHHVQFLKHQGNPPGQALQLSVPQPFIAGGQQPLAVPSHIPFLQPPFLANHPVRVLASNGHFSTKLP
ncbi:uncharacterized protein LOC111301602 isoform X2 [Durio zibethinus]|uniref:Uncharacterized protein LOC111301602 isoform X2 n=1 Tax=Durio zibethinus TaxID=66656 RepID=A0A6P5ZL30_DURZI|nr:uncharacterized protein LOC111301602 isoform X2 [Durio zibethinus]